MPASAAKPIDRLFSVTGVLPLGAYVILHLARNARALAGAAAFERAATWSAKLPLFLEVVLVGLPLAFHAAYGAYLAIKAIPLRGESVYESAHVGGLAKAMRVTGLVALAYLAFHLYDYATALARLSPASEYTLAAGRLSSATATFPLRAVLEVAGEGTVLFHFCVGLWGFCVARGWAGSRSARRWSAVAFSAIGAALFLVSFDTIVLFATGTRLFGKSEPSPLELGPSSVVCPPSK